MHSLLARVEDTGNTLNAIFYLVDNGNKWRSLPDDFPKWPSVYHDFRQWRQDGTWQRIHDTLRSRLRQQSGRHKHATAGCLDSQSVQSASLPGVRGFDAHKPVNGRKRHILVDTLLPGPHYLVRFDGSTVAASSCVWAKLAHTV